MKTPPMMMGGPPPHGGFHGGGHESFSGGRGSHKPRRERSLEEIMVTVWLTPENAAFALRNGLLYLTAGDHEQRVSLRRVFPFEKLWEYISVLNTDEEEVGIIRDLDGWDAETRDLLHGELERRYYSPVITRINSFKERYGFSYWKVTTPEGDMEFTLHDTYKSLIRVGSDRVILLDVDGNRFEIPDVHALDHKSYRKIELYL